MSLESSLGVAMPGNHRLRVDLLQRTVEVVERRRVEAVTYFYSYLFASHPELRSVFPITDVKQHDRLFRGLVHVVKNSHLMSAMADDLAQVGREHRKFDTVVQHYRAVGESLLAAVAAVLGDAWSPEVAAAWQSAYRNAAEIMVRAAATVPHGARRWWTAEVVKHERRTWDIAVITVRPTEPFPYTPGQYVTIETPHWPRLWRPYSIANAPRADGTLEFHVRQIDGGQASWALVDAIHPGHAVKLGPACGTLVLDHANPRDVLLVAGGTGLAPLKALVEDVAAHGGKRRVCLFVGARTEDDLYDLDALAELHRQHEWLAIIPAVSEEPEYSGHRGLICDVVAQYGPWNAFEAYICGPPAMVEATRRRLTEIGIPARQIHHEVWQADIDEHAVAGRTQLVAYAGAQPHVYAPPQETLGRSGEARMPVAVPASHRASPPSHVHSETAHADLTEAERRTQEIRAMIELKRARRSMYSRRR